MFNFQVLALQSEVSHGFAEVRRRGSHVREDEVIVEDQLNAEEWEILEKFGRDELRPATGVDREMAIAPQAARNTFKKTVDREEMRRTTR